METSPDDRLRVAAKRIKGGELLIVATTLMMQGAASTSIASVGGSRDPIGDEGAEWLLTTTIEAGRASGAVKDESLSQVSIDTTVMEKNIAYPTDARLYEKARAKIVALAKEAGGTLRQTCARKAPRLAMQVGRYANARQFKRMRKSLTDFEGVYRPGDA